MEWWNVYGINPCLLDFLLFNLVWCESNKAIFSNLFAIYTETESLIAWMLHPFFSCSFHNFVTSSCIFCAFHVGTLDRNLNRSGVAPFIFSLSPSFCCFFFLPFHSVKDDFIFRSPPFRSVVDGTIIYQSMNLFCCVSLFFFPYPIGC